MLSGGGAKSSSHGSRCLVHVLDMTVNFPRLSTQVLHEITMKSIHGRNAEGKKVAKATVQRGKLEDGTPVIGMTMVDQDFRCGAAAGVRD